MNKRLENEIDSLKKRYGTSWRKHFHIKKNYPFGRNSKPMIKIVKK